MWHKLEIYVQFYGVLSGHFGYTISFKVNNEISGFINGIDCLGRSIYMFYKDRPLPFQHLGVESKVVNVF